MFFGRYDYTIDAKGRLNFPAKFRDAMGESFVVLEWVDNCLFALPMEEVQRLADKLESDELMNSWAVSGDLFSTACEVVPDKQGRILLPAELRAYAGLEKDVTIIGNRNHAEIWATEVWNARRAGTTSTLDQLVKYPQFFHMPLVNGSYWAMVHGSNPEQVLQDAEGCAVMQELGRNMAWLLHCIEAGKAAGIDHPQNPPRPMTNFIR